MIQTMLNIKTAIFTQDFPHHSQLLQCKILAHTKETTIITAVTVDLSLVVTNLVIPLRKHRIHRISKGISQLVVETYSQ